MITLHISDNHFEIDDKITEYIQEKIGGLDRYLPKVNKNASGKVILRTDPSGREDNQYVCEVTLEVPGPNLVAKEAAINMYTAIDIVVAKLKAQALKYKEKHATKPNRAKTIMNRFFGRVELEAEDVAEA
jgi:putative sigma-54 modulation protein